MDKNIVTIKILFSATVSGIKPNVLDNKIKINKTDNQFKKFIFLKNNAPFKF
jgi:hypothetical protein